VAEAAELPGMSVSVHDPKMRHGRKSASPRYDGHKGAIAADPASQLIVAGTVLPGNAQDHNHAFDAVEQACVFTILIPSPRRGLGPHRPPSSAGQVFGRTASGAPGV